VSVAKGTDSQAEGVSFRKAVGTKEFWPLALLSFCNMFLINVVVVHLVIFAVGLDIRPTIAATILSVAAAVSIPARVGMGAVADRIGNIPALTLCLAVSVVAFTLLLLCQSLLMLYAFAVLYGFGLWASGAIVSPLVADLFGLGSHGTILGVTVLAQSLGGAVGPVVAGYIFDATGGYQAAFTLCLGMSVVSLAAVVILGRIRAGNRHADG
jgi:MFS family permease